MISLRRFGTNYTGSTNIPLQIGPAGPDNTRFVSIFFYVGQPKMGRVHNFEKSLWSVHSFFHLSKLNVNFGKIDQNYSFVFQSTCIQFDLSNGIMDVL